MKKEKNFYCDTGEVICYSPDEEHIYLQSGIPVGYISNEKVYSFSGRVLGWFYSDWLYDRDNRPALFSEKSTGGPVRPVKKVRPVRGVKKVRPVKGVKQVAHVRPVRSLSWSLFSGEQYFSQ